MSQTTPPASLKTYSLKNRKGMSMIVTNFGGKVMTLNVPDRHGVPADIVLGFTKPEEYINGNPYFGAIIGRCGNRIARGQFTLDGKVYQLPINNGPNHLHGGPIGFQNSVWDVTPITVNGDEALELTYTSPAGEAGYPGTLKAKVIYVLTRDNELSIEYSAVTDAPTVVNLTHHNFYNLAGADSGSIVNHSLMLFASRFTPVSAGLIPTGELRSVEDTPFDFRKFHTIGQRIDANDEQLRYGNGYDHNWVLDKPDGNALTLAAVVSEPGSGRIMEVFTTEPGMQLYTGNFLDNTDIGKTGKPYGYRTAFCLEAQHFPDSPNHSHFPSVILRPGTDYYQKTIYKFSTED